MKNIFVNLNISHFKNLILLNENIFEKSRYIYYLYPKFVAQDIKALRSISNIDISS